MTATDEELDAIVNGDDEGVEGNGENDAGELTVITEERLAKADATYAKYDKTQMKGLTSSPAGNTKASVKFEDQEPEIPDVSNVAMSPKRKSVKRV